MRRYNGKRTHACSVTRAKATQPYHCVEQLPRRWVQAAERDETRPLFAQLRNRKARRLYLSPLFLFSFQAIRAEERVRALSQELRLPWNP